MSLCTTRRAIRPESLNAPCSAPMADGRIFGSAQDVALARVGRVPREAIAFLRVAGEGDVGLDGVVGRLRRVFCPVKDVDGSRGRLGGDQVGVLRHVAGAVDLALVVDGLLDAHAGADVAVRSDLCQSFAQKGSFRLKKADYLLAGRRSRPP
jgi:hypothetical protein